MFYPDMGAPSSVVDRYIQILKNKYNFYVITKTYKQNSEFKHKSNIHYITSFRHRVQLWCEKNLSNNKLKIISKIIINTIGIYKLFLTQFSRPTANSWESKAYYRELENLNKNLSLDVVVSVSNTVFTQYAANKFKKKHPNIKWIQFVTDPFTENYIYYRYKLFPKLWKKFNTKDEFEFYKNSDCSLLTPELAKSIRLKYPQLVEKCFQMEFTLTDLSIVKSIKSVDSDKIKLIYAGAVYKNIRNPEYMMREISLIPEVKLDIFTNLNADRGECNEILLRNIADNISINEFVPKDRYNELIYNEYDILVNIGNISDLQTPSKMLDLLSTGKPILNFYFVRDSQFEMIERYPLGLNIHCGDSNVTMKILQFCRENKGRRLSFEEIKQLYPQNVLEHQAELFEYLIEC